MCAAVSVFSPRPMSVDDKIAVLTSLVLASNRRLATVLTQQKMNHQLLSMENAELRREVAELKEQLDNTRYTLIAQHDDRQEQHQKVLRATEKLAQLSINVDERGKHTQTDLRPTRVAMTGGGGGGASSTVDKQDNNTFDDEGDDSEEGFYFH